ncbi:MAG: CesD/SycD/LcrH family type III secretion system chaperone [Comamonadaceae bacterium]|nr:MAG: CesD/SycD/LcrH family type III secretion system chaperone [Comamonadaceae bacterium]
MAEETVSAALDQGIELLRQMMQGNTLAPLMGVSVGDQEAIYALAYAAYTQARYEEAMQAFSYLMTVDHLDRRFCSGFAACLRAQKRHAEALKYYFSASLLDLTDPEPVMRMAECHLALNDKPQARAALAYGLDQARAHETHRSYVPRLEAMLSFLNTEGPAATTGATCPAGSPPTDNPKENAL